MKSVQEKMHAYMFPLLLIIPTPEVTLLQLGIYFLLIWKKLYKVSSLDYCPRNPRKKAVKMIKR